MLHKTVLCQAGTEKLTWGSVFRWKSFDSVKPSVPLSVPALSPVCTWRLYPSTSTVWDVVWQRYSLTKESILSGCLSYLSIYLSCLSIRLFFMPFTPNQMCWNQSVTGAERGLVQPKLKSSMLECPIDPCSVYKRKSFSRPKKEGGDNPSKEDLAVINVAYSLFSETPEIMWLAVTEKPKNQALIPK